MSGALPTPTMSFDTPGELRTDEYAESPLASLTQQECRQFCYVDRFGAAEDKLWIFAQKKGRHRRARQARRAINRLRCPLPPSGWRSP